MTAPPQQNFTIIIPFYSETRALAFSRFYFDKIGWKPIYALDSKKVSRRGEAEKTLGREVMIYDNPGGFVEAHFERLAALAPTDWILRVDCDEVPTVELLEHCGKFADRPTDNVCGFDRDDLLWRGDHFDRIKYRFLFQDTQFRLFNRAKVKFTPKIHTPGYHVAPYKIPYFSAWSAPAKARLYHLWRSFTPEAERIKKMQGRTDYDRSVGLKFADWSLRPDSSFNWQAVKAPFLEQAYRDWLSSGGDNTFQ